MGEHEPRITGGYVLLPRKVFDSDLSARPAWERWLWVWLIGKAEHRPKADGRKLDRGQLFTTIEAMREAVGHWVGCRPVKPDRAAVAKALRRLRESNRITTTKTTRGSIISINNYGLYQDPANYESNTPARMKAERRPHEVPHDRQEGKNDKKGEAASPPASDASRKTPKPASEGNGAANRLVALWARGCMAREIVFGNRGQVSGLLAGMVKVYGEGVLTQAVGRWWGADRADYGFPLFKARLDGGNRELTGRAAAAVDDDAIALANGRRLEAEHARRAGA